MVSYINPNDKAREVVSHYRYPTVPKRFVYSLQRSMNRGLLFGYAGAGTDKVSAAVKKNELFLGSTDRVGEFIDKGFSWICLGNDGPRVLAQAGADVVNVEEIAE
jgi:hypothetical protein